MKTEVQGVQVISPHGTGRGSHYITLARAPGDTLDALLKRAMAALRDTGAALVSMDILGLPMNEGLRALERVTGEIAWPLLWIAGPRPGETGGIQLWAESDAAVTPIRLDGQVVGSLVDTPCASICRLGGLTGRIPTRTEAEQTEAALYQLEDALHAAGMGFGGTPCAPGTTTATSFPGTMISTAPETRSSPNTASTRACCPRARASARAT